MTAHETDHDAASITLHDRVHGCLLGGAIGDALGWPVEFDALDVIRTRFGDDGITELVVDPRTGTASVTDDTQMTLFTAEALVTARRRSAGPVLEGVHDDLRASYRRWLSTQLLARGTAAAGALHGDDGWLVHVAALHARRAPGATCLSAIRSPDFATHDRARNDSKGCGGVMRVAPCGLLASVPVTEAWRLGCTAAALTHGHPTGWIAAGAFAVIVRMLLDGATVGEAVRVARGFVAEAREEEPLAQETLDALDGAVAFAAREAAPTAASIAALGEGWIAEEALGIGVACALVGERTGDVAGALRLAVNHAGDSDSTGSVAGQLLGARLGVRALPVRWREGVELGEVIGRIADEIVAASTPIQR